MRPILLILAGLTMMLAQEGGAGTIHLQPDVRIEVTNGHPYAVVEVFNGGDEPARITGLEAGLSAGRNIGRILSRTVSPGDVIHERLLVFEPSGLPGFYQGITRIRYADFTGGKFTSVSVSGFPWPGPDTVGLSDWVVPSVSQLSMGRVGTLRVSMLLIQDDPASVTVRLVLPDELDCPAPEQRVVLEPDSTRDVTFEITNRGALPGGGYPVFAIVEQDVPGFHRSASAAGAVTVTDIKWVGQSVWVWLAGSFGLIALLGLATRGRRVSCQPAWLDAAFLVLISGFIVWQFSPVDLISNTTPVGGDTPAHLYLVSHLREQLFQHGRIISWAGGWWSGFPMFQYYFVLPYLVSALLSFLIPLSVAFKMVSMAGVVMTPLCAYWAGRLWRLPQPVPLVLGMAMLPFLFVHSHTMWGVNTASTLAGMIANSWSFALMLPALASASRDAEEGRFRMVTVFLMTLVLASHFFTSVMMFLTLTIVPVLCPRKERFRALKVLLLEGLLAVLIMAWWLVPLVTKSGFSMDFGTNWDVTLWKSLPPYSAGLGALVLFAIGLEGRALSRPPVIGHDEAWPSRNPAVWMLLWMLLIGVLLFKFGFAVSPVFVNVRLWPFIFFALIALAAFGLGRLLQPVCGRTVWLAVLMAGLVLGVMAGDSPTGRLTDRGITRSWAKWNYSGLEAKPAASVFEKLVIPLKGTPGRLANDLCEENNQLGSSRVFELTPCLAGKAILEGGLVNSALGSMYAYTIQGESSDACAGFPPIVTPQPFNFTNATRHLELFNVKQFIARSERTKQALSRQSGWRFVAREQEWELYELMTHEGRMVFVPPRQPLVVETRRWKECSLEWLTTMPALDQFVIWQDGAEARVGQGVPAEPGVIHQTERQFLDLLAGWRQGSTNGMAAVLPEAGTRCIRSEVVSDDRIRFTTTAIGQPHIVKVSWFPNWKVRGAKRVYRVSPGFMLVYPEQENVELYYGTTWSDGVGYALTLVGLLGVMLVVKTRGRDGALTFLK